MFLSPPTHRYQTVDKHYIRAISLFPASIRWVWFSGSHGYLHIPHCLQDCYLVSVLNELAGNSFMVFCGTCNNVQRLVSECASE